jgi:hypothetical protein
VCGHEALGSWYGREGAGHTPDRRREGAEAALAYQSGDLGAEAAEAAGAVGDDQPLRLRDGGFDGGEVEGDEAAQVDDLEGETFLFELSGGLERPPDMKRSFAA